MHCLETNSLRHKCLSVCQNLYFYLQPVTSQPTASLVTPPIIPMWLGLPKEHLFRLSFEPRGDREREFPGDLIGKIFFELCSDQGLRGTMNQILSHAFWKKNFEALICMKIPREGANRLVFDLILSFYNEQLLLLYSFRLVILFHFLQTWMYFFP